MDNRAKFFRTKFKTKRVEIIKFWFRYDATTKTNLQAVHAIFCTNIVNLVLAHPVYLYLFLPQSHLLKTVHILLAWFGLILLNFYTALNYFTCLAYIFVHWPNLLKNCFYTVSPGWPVWNFAFILPAQTCAVFCHKDRLAKCSIVVFYFIFYFNT